MSVRSSYKDAARRVWQATLDICAASYHVQTIVLADEEGNDIRKHVAVKTRGDQPFYQRSIDSAVAQGKTIGAFELPYPALGAEATVWWQPSRKIAESVAASHQRSLAARRRTLLTIIGIAIALISRWWLGCLL